MATISTSQSNKQTAAFPTSIYATPSAELGLAVRYVAVRSLPPNTTGAPGSLSFIGLGCVVRDVEVAVS